MYFRNTGSRKSPSPLALALAGMLLAGAGFTSSAWAELPPLQHQGAVTYVSGGIGIDESTSFKQAMSHYPLAMTFAEQEGKQGDYLADVKVVIKNARLNTVLDTTAQGPYMLVKLQPGHYRISATFKDQTKTRNITIGRKGSEHLVFEWKPAASANT